jgi:integrase
VVPITQDFCRLVKRIVGVEARHAEDQVSRARSAFVALASACRAVGVPHITHHDLRHLFATTCIEAEVDIPTVSNWLGQADGGALAMNVYGLIRPQHSAEAARKVSFTPLAAPSGI